LIAACATTPKTRWMARVRGPDWQPGIVLSTHTSGQPKTAGTHRDHLEDRIVVDRRRGPGPTATNEPGSRPRSRSRDPADVLGVETSGSSVTTAPRLTPMRRKRVEGQRRDHPRRGEEEGGDHRDDRHGHQVAHSGAAMVAERPDPRPEEDDDDHRHVDGKSEREVGGVASSQPTGKVSAVVGEPVGEVQRPDAEGKDRVGEVVDRPVATLRRAGRQVDSTGAGTSQPGGGPGGCWSGGDGSAGPHSGQSAVGQRSTISTLRIARAFWAANSAGFFSRCGGPCSWLQPMTGVTHETFNQ
jgi:hypothetical protein